MRAAKVQASLRIRAVSPEPSLLAHTSSESRGTFRQKARSLALLNGWACAVEIGHDGMLEDTNSLDEAHMMYATYQCHSILPNTGTIKCDRTWQFKGNIAIRRIFSLVAHDYKDQIFKLVRFFCNLHVSVGKFINFSIGITSQRFVTLNSLKFAFYAPTPFFSCFNTGYNIDQISRKCRGIFQRHKC